VVDETTCRTSKEGVNAGVDAVTARHRHLAMGAAKGAAAIDEYIKGKG
jgi:hypothetical protein